jgi:hypothetical protein
MVDGKTPQTLLETLNVTNQDLYPNIYAIFTVLITMSVSSASRECSFSAMRSVKKLLELQWVMRDYQNRTRNLSVEDVINTFAVRKNR